ncbi:YidB family protein [Streptomyces sp. NBC_00536]|uniref:YidB family protein n=1 Tax=Streptomyces sp. NBC_00536 TaxID=2975769 RepID=UPI002E81BB22|nr:YidB family protein [Streptomyces sp. NBC_00536]WUC83050.1 YidB family protein [Streptomyces sp. NBC_00536]
MNENTVTPVLGQLLTALAASPATAGKFDSWTGGGANEPLTGEEVSAAAPTGMLPALAELAQVSETEAAAALAEEIPALVDAIPAETIELFRSAARIADLTPEEDWAAERIESEAFALATALPQTSSWLGAGPNEPLTEEQVTQALGDDTLAALAEMRGWEKAEVVTELTRVLPGFIDAISPNGWVDPDLLRLLLAQDEVTVTDVTDVAVTDAPA